jgi:hypothetical protein
MIFDFLCPCSSTLIEMIENKVYVDNNGADSFLKFVTCGQVCFRELGVKIMPIQGRQIRL